MPAVQVKNLYIYNAKKALVQNVSFTIEHGQTLALMGASGSGKSLTAMALVNALNPNLHYQAEQLQFTGNKPALIMQNPADCFDPLFNVQQTFLETLCPQQSRQEAIAYMFELLDEVGLDANTAKFYPFELSGGMLHKVMIALAIARVQMGGASCIIADEPIAGLDCSSKVLLLNRLKQLQKKYHFALLYIDHDLASAKLMADEIAIMQDGQVIECGKVHDILNHPTQLYTKELITTFKDISQIQTSEQLEHNNECILKCQGLHKSYANFKKPILQNINFELLRGESLGIVGNNGAGKSTLLHILLDLKKADSGNIHILGQDIHKLQSNNAWRKHIQAVFQHARTAVNPRMNVRDILMEPLLAQGIHNKSEQVEELLNLVQLPSHYVKAYPNQMSGGQLQRLCIARALALKPDILLLDEPLTDLDAVIAEGILKMLINIKQQLNITLLYISHDIRSVLKLCERILVLDKGQLVDDFKSTQYQSAKRHKTFKTLITSSII